MIYLDNAATTLKKPPCVIEAVCAAMNSMGNASRGAHGGSLHASRMVYETREKLAKLFGCPRPDHVIFTQNSTESLNLAIRGAIPAGSHVITTDLEHNSVLRPLYLMEAEQGVKLSFVAADQNGAVKVEDFESLIQADTSALVCTHASNLTGNRIDIEAVGAIAKRHNLLFIVDASQSAGAMEIDMERMGIDILCFTGHKGLMGPQGTGGLCVREGVQIRPLKVGGSGIKTYSKTHPVEMPTALEAGTLNSHGIAGLSAALDYLFEVGVDAIEEKENALMRRFYDGVVNIPGVKIYGDFTAEKRGAIVTLNIGDYDSGAVSDELSEVYDIATRAGAHCAPRMHEALGTVDQGAVRFSFSWFNTEQEVDAAIRAVREMAEE